MVNDNNRYVARVPIVPDDLSNQDSHKNHELVMDFKEDDIYVKKDDGYVNITGKIKEDIKQIQDGSAVIHIVTEDTIPPVRDRDENHWYYVVTRSKDYNGENVSTTSYVYYGLIKSYDHDANYILIAQNIISGSGTIKFDILEGYMPCVYVPINYAAIFTDHETGEEIESTIEDRIYAMNSKIGTYVAYDVYLLQLFEPGVHIVDMNLNGSDHFTVKFEANSEGIQGLKLPDSISVKDGHCIGNIPDPEWDDPRFIFKGWSTNKIAETIIDPTSYKPNDNMTLFAWFDYNSDPDVLTYYTTSTSIGG